MKKIKSLPPGVKNEKLYQEYLKVQEKLNKESKISVKTIEGEEIELNLQCQVHFFRKKYNDLIGESLVEELISTKFKDIRSLMGEMIQAKNKAFNRKFGKASESYLDTRKAELIEMFGRFFNLNEIHKTVVKDWGYDIAKPTLDKFRLDNIETIEERQKEYLRSHSNVRLSHKRSRLDELTYLYEDRKEIYDDKGKHRDDFKLLLQALEQVRKEVEGDIFTFDGKIEVDIKQTLNIHIQQEALKDLNINNIIISRVAARIGCNPYYILQALNNSFYAKFSRFKQVKEEEFNNILYPSQLTYNWDEIKSNEKNRIARENKMKDFDEAVVINTPEERETADEFKNSLIQNLKERQITTNIAMKRVDELDKENNRLSVKDKLSHMLNEGNRQKVIKGIQNKKNKEKNE